MDWPFRKAEVPFSLKNDRKVHTSVSALEVSAGCDNMFANQWKSDLSILMNSAFQNDGREQLLFHKNPMFNSTKTHITRALRTRITFGAQLKISFVERLKQSHNDNEQQLLLQNLETIK